MSDALPRSPSHRAPQPTIRATSTWRHRSRSSTSSRPKMRGCPAPSRPRAPRRPRAPSSSWRTPSAEAGRLLYVGRGHQRTARGSRRRGVSAHLRDAAGNGGGDHRGRDAGAAQRGRGRRGRRERRHRGHGRTAGDAPATWSSASRRAGPRPTCARRSAGPRRWVRAPVSWPAPSRPHVLRNTCDVCIVVLVGPEVVTGSTRMKAGTATKLVLNTITTGRHDPARQDLRKPDGRPARLERQARGPEPSHRDGDDRTRAGGRDRGTASAPMAASRPPS